MKKLLLSLLLCLPPVLAWANAITLDATTKTLEVTTTGTTVSMDYVVSYVDGTTTTFVPGTNQGNIASATTTAILAAPAASTQRAVSLITLVNKAAVANTVQLKVDVSATEYAMTPVITLAAGESLRVDNTGTATVMSASGIRRESGYVNPGFQGADFNFYKVGATSEAVAVNYLHNKDSGFPGAWVLGTPGLNGANFDCSSTGGATVAGAPYIPNAPTGTWYLTYGSIAATVAHSMWVADLLWYNTGIVVTTTTAQGITTAAFPARDNQGSTNGEGYQAALYAVATAGNAGAVTNTTLNYTNSEGTASRTATIASVPATLTAGAIIPFQLQAGDRGIRSIQGITLGTTYTSGTLSLLLFNLKMRVPAPVVNVGTIPYPPQSPGVRLYNGTCLSIGYLASATTATNTSASFWIMER